MAASHRWTPEEMKIVIDRIHALPSRSAAALWMQVKAEGIEHFLEGLHWRVRIGETEAMSFTAPELHLLRDAVGCLVAKRREVLAVVTKASRDSQRFVPHDFAIPELEHLSARLDAQYRLNYREMKFSG